MDINTINNILAFLSRVDLKGSEVPAFNAVIEKLHAYASTLNLAQEEDEVLPDA
jgi:hypothetical protein